MVSFCWFWMWNHIFSLLSFFWLNVKEKRFASTANSYKFYFLCWSLVCLFSYLFVFFSPSAGLRWAGSFCYLLQTSLVLSCTQPSKNTHLSDLCLFIFFYRLDNYCFLSWYHHNQILFHYSISIFYFSLWYLLFYSFVNNDMC